MKKALKISAITLGLIVLAIVILPFVFQGKIKEAVIREANKSLNATLGFNSVNLSLIRSFPDFSLRLKGLTIAGINEFEGDTLASIPDLRLTIDLMSVFRGNSYEIETVALDRPVFKVKVLPDGLANYDIIKPSTDTATGPDEGESSFRASIRKFSITDGILVYDDASLGFRAEAVHINHKLSGDLTASLTDLNTETSIDELTVDYEGVRYMSRSKADLVSKISADLNAWKFTFPDARLTVNDLKLLASGYFAMPDEGYDMDISFEALENDFRSFLSLIPAIYSKDFEKVKAEGTLSLKGFVKGLYSDATMPGFGAGISIADARFSYPGLPAAVENINMQAGITNPDGNPDATIIDVSKLHLEMAGNPVDIRLYTRTPVSDPYIDASIKGRLNLADVAKFYPLESGDELSGLLDADLSAKGNLSAIERKQYDQFVANGNLDIERVNYKTTAVAEKISVSKASLKLSPAIAEMPVLRMQIGKNDLSAAGKLENMLGWFFGKGDLIGSLSLTSSYFNVNDFMSGNTVGEGSADSTVMEAVEIPAGIDFTMDASFGQVIYDNMDMKNVAGVMRIKDQQLYLDNLKMNTLEGTVAVNGSYATKEPGKPQVDFELDIRDVDVQKAFRTFNTMEKLAPVASVASGKISTQLKLATSLDGSMMPVYSTINGGGKLMSPALTFTNVNTFSRIGDALKIDKLKSWAIEKINLSFEMVDGKVFVKPFETAIGKTKANISGWNSFDETMEYVMQLSVPRSEFGGAANKVLTNLVNEANSKGADFTLGDYVPVEVLIGGTISNPRVSTSLKHAATGAVEEMKKQITETIQQKKEEAVTKVKEEAAKYLEEANARSQKLLADAQKQADNIMKTARESADDIRTEADKRAEQLVSEGKKKGPIAELAAKKAAEKVRKEADAKAGKLVSEAQKQSDNVMQAARNESDKLIQEARNKSQGN